MISDVHQYKIVKENCKREKGIRKKNKKKEQEFKARISGIQEIEFKKLKNINNNSKKQ